MGKIILFYKYVEIKNPQDLALWQKELCLSLGLKGRVILATEGINGTVGGQEESIEAYIKSMEAHPLFGSIDFKEAAGDELYFPRLRIMVKKEIVNLGIDPKELTIEKSGQYLTPEEAHELMSNPPADLVILDTRNKYETEIGTFTDALAPNTRYFREFPSYIDANLDLFKNKQVLMTCTGGVRCERASAYLNIKGVAKKVMHLKGGIHRYIEKYPDGHFKGSNYVFDARISHTVTKDILGTCNICSAKSDYYENCKNAFCNKHFIVCFSCKESLGQACSTKCFELIQANQVIVRKKEARVHP